MAKRASKPEAAATVAKPAPAAAAETAPATSVAEAPADELPADMPADLKPEAPAADDGEITIHDELLDFARAFTRGFADQGANEKDDKYITRLMTAIFDAPGPTDANPNEEDEFETLSAEAQTWFNDAVEESKADKPVTPPAGFTSKFVSGKAGRPAKPEKAAKAEKPAKVKKEKVAKEEGVTGKLRRIIIMNLDKDDDTLEIIVREQLPTVHSGTLGVQRSEVRRVMALAKECGLLK